MYNNNNLIFAQAGKEEKVDELIEGTGITILSLVFIFLIATVASIIQRVSGFGSGIFAMIFLPYIVGSFGEANALSGLWSMCATIAVALSMLKRVRWKDILFPAIGFTALTIPSILFMKSQPDTVLFILLGAVLILLSVYFFFFSSKIKIRATWYGGLISGGLSGIMGGLFAMGGPPVVVYFLQSSGNDNNAYLATIQAYFFITNAIGATVKAINGYVTLRVLVYTVVGAAGMYLGIFIGRLIFRKLNPETLRRVVYAFMAVSGVVNIVTALV